MAACAMMPRRFEGDLGSLTDIEISAVGDSNGSAHFVALLLRDVTQRTRRRNRPASRSELSILMRCFYLSLGRRWSGRLSVEAIELQYVSTEALERTPGPSHRSPPDISASAGRARMRSSRKWASREK